MPSEDGSGRTEPVPKGTRWFVRAFLAAFIVCGVAGIEAWPLTGFRLFSHLRDDHTIAWVRTAVDAGGNEHALDLSGLAPRYRSFVLVAKTFGSHSRADQDAMCRTWMSALRELDPGTVAMRVYRSDQALVPRRDGHPAQPALRSLVFTCTGSGVSGAGP